MSRPSSPLVAGQTLLGRFRVERPLGEGGMGAVHLAQHVALEMPVAIKVIAAEPTSDRWAVLQARFVREARTLARMRSEFVCRVLDFGSLDTGEPFLILEFIEGHSLATVAAHESLSLETMIDFVAQGIAGLAEAHRWKLVHRDIKPSNLLVASVQGGRRQTKVIDFGLVRTSDAEAIVTRGDGVLGTPEFMSPEQVLSAHDVDARTDVWSLGATLFWLVTKELPFEGPTRLALLASIVNDPPRVWLMEGKAIPPGLRDAILDCLAKNPQDRPANVAVLGERLAPFAGPEGRRAIELAALSLKLPLLPNELAEDEARGAISDVRAQAPPTMSAEYWKGGDATVTKSPPSTRPKKESSRSTHAREFVVPKVQRRRG
jgi:serine/threonine protein kinase